MTTTKLLSLHSFSTNNKRLSVIMPKIIAVYLIVAIDLISHLITCQLLDTQAPFLPAQPVRFVQRRQILVPGSEALMRDASRVDRVVMPNEQPSAREILEQQHQNGSVNLADMSSNIIDHKRFVEYVAARCFASTAMDNVDHLEPSFVIIRPRSEIRINATASPDRIMAAGFEPRKPTFVIVHGFTQSYPNTDWLRRLRGLFEVNGHVNEQNLIFMDWGTASHGAYGQVAAQASGIGSFLANFIMKLTDDLGADRASVHVIGHSLGAHVAGFAGKRLWPRIGRITALDPAGPCFGKVMSNSASDRLSPDDAYQVDVYHYDDSFLGLAGPVGQFDVYVNGGSSQPGAKHNIYPMFDAVITMVFRRNRVLSESHTRSTEVPTAQLARRDCFEMAYECRDWPTFLNGECGICDDRNSQCHFMGFKFQYATRTIDYMPLKQSFPGKQFYITTSGKDQYCLQHYQVLVKLEPNPEMAQQAKQKHWHLHLELINEHHERLNITVTNQMGPNVFSYLLLSNSEPSRFRAAALQIRQLNNMIVPIGERRETSHALYGPDYAKSTANVAIINRIEINFMSHYNLNFRRAFSSTLCPQHTLTNYNAISDASLAGDDWLGLRDC